MAPIRDSYKKLARFASSMKNCLYDVCSYLRFRRTTAADSAGGSNQAEIADTERGTDERGIDADSEVEKKEEEEEHLDDEERGKKKEKEGETSEVEEMIAEKENPLDGQAENLVALGLPHPSALGEIQKDPGQEKEKKKGEAEVTIGQKENAEDGQAENLLALVSPDSTAPEEKVDSQKVDE